MLGRQQLLYWRGEGRGGRTTTTQRHFLYFTKHIINM